MTLISTHNSDGCTGRCDAKCYNATEEACDCCCGGMNHGKGLQTAMELTSQYAEKVIENWEAEHPEEKIEIEPQQLELFA